MRNGIRIERVDDADAECHSCGKVGRPRYLIHFAHLCQHFVALCGLCWRRLAAEKARFAAGQRSGEAPCAGA